MSLADIFSRRARSTGGGSGDTSGSGGESYTIENHTSGKAFDSTDFGKLHIITSASNLAFTLPEAALAQVGKRMGFEKRGTGTIDLNALAGNPDTVVGETDIENTTADTNAVIWLYVDAANSWNVDGAGRGLWL